MVRSAAAVLDLDYIEDSNAETDAKDDLRRDANFHRITLAHREQGPDFVQGGFGSLRDIRSQQQRVTHIDDPELLLASCQAYNDWLLDWTSVAPDRRPRSMVTTRP